MIKENQRFLNGVLVLIDTLVIIFSLFLAYQIRFKTTLFGPIGGTLPLWNYALFTIFAVLPTYLLLYYFFGLYKPFRNQSSIFSGTTKIIRSSVVAFVVLVAVLFIIEQPNYSRIMLLLLSIFIIFFTEKQNYGRKASKRFPFAERKIRCFAGICVFCSVLYGFV